MTPTEHADDCVNDFQEELCDWVDANSTVFQERIRNACEASARDAVNTVPQLDAHTAHEVEAFLHWTIVALHRLNTWNEDPYRCLEDIQQAADVARLAFEGDAPASYRLPDPKLTVLR